MSHVDELTNLLGGTQKPLIARIQSILDPDRWLYVWFNGDTLCAWYGPAPQAAEARARNLYWHADIEECRDVGLSLDELRALVRPDDRAPPPPQADPCW